MNITYTVKFNGVPEKMSSAVDKTLRELIAVFPQRISMESASVEGGAEAVKADPQTKRAAERIVAKAKKVKDAKS